MDYDSFLQRLHAGIARWDSLSPEEWYDSSAGVRAWRIGHIVIVSVMTGAINAAGVGATTVLTTLPQGWRPANTAMSTCVAGGSAYDIAVTSNGDLSIWNMTGTGIYVRANIAYATSG